MASSPITPWQIEGEKVEVVTNLFLLGSEVTADGDYSHETRKYLLLGRKAGQCAEKQRHYSADKSPYSQGCGLPSGHAQLWELDCKEDGALKNQCLPTVVLEKTPESPLDSKEIKPVNLKGNQPWVLDGRTDAEVETPVFWSFDVKADSLEKSLMLEKIEGWRRGRQRMRWLDGITNTMHMNLGKLREMVTDRKVWHAVVHVFANSRTQLGDWTKTKCSYRFIFKFMPSPSLGWRDLGRLRVS